jgi:hypothetical protein
MLLLLTALLHPAELYSRGRFIFIRATDVSNKAICSTHIEGRTGLFSDGVGRSGLGAQMLIHVSSTSVVMCSSRVAEPETSFRGDIRHAPSTTDVIAMHISIPWWNI